MVVAEVVLPVVLAALLVLSGRGKLVEAAMIMGVMRHVDVSDGVVRVLAYLEIAGAAGLLVGLALPWVGTLTGACVVAYSSGPSSRTCASVPGTSSRRPCRCSSPSSCWSPVGRRLTAALTR